MWPWSKKEVKEDGITLLYQYYIKLLEKEKTEKAEKDVDEHFVGIIATGVAAGIVRAGSKLENQP